MNKVVFIVALVAVVAFAAHIADNRKMIREINSKQSLWKAAPNRMTHMSHKFGHKFLSHGIMKGNWNRKTYSNGERAAVPDSFDARTQWPKCTTIGTIENQKHAGSAWPMIAVQVMSDRNCIAKGEDVMLSLSDVDTCSDCGYMSREKAYCVWAYWVNTGIVSNECYPESSSTGICPKKCTGNPSLNWDSDKRKGKSNYTISGEEDMKTELVNNGPFQVLFQVYSDFMSYQSGIYTHASGGFEGTHTVKVLGYGVENGVKYWLCANCWGTSWGENGFFRILRGSNECGIEETGYAGIPAQ